MQTLCPPPDILFQNVPNLSDSVKRTGTRPFAHGGYSDIWTGISWHNDVTRQVAIKIIRVTGQSNSSTEKLKRRISREVITWNQVQHKNVVPFYGLFWMPEDTGNDLPAMVYPYCPAGTCSEYLKRRPGADRMSIIRQVADGLIHLHSEQVVHGDLKASNILMWEDGTPMLADFGLSRIIAEVSTGLTSSSNRGSWRWMSPELFGGIDDHIQVLVTTESDVWAFACLCLEILTDALPWSTIKTAAGIIKAMSVHRRQPSLAPLVESSLIAHIMRHCWLYEPNDRPSVEAIAEALDTDNLAALHRPHCLLDSPSRVLVETPERLPALGDADSFTQEFSGAPLMTPGSGQTRTPVARISRQDQIPLFTPPLSTLCPPAPIIQPLTPSTDATGATPYMDSLGLTPTDSMSSEPSSGLVSRDEPPLFDKPLSLNLATDLPGPERREKSTRGARRTSGSIWPRTPLSSSSTLPPTERGDTAFRSDLWQRSDPSTPASTRCSSRASYPTPPRTASYHHQHAGHCPSRLSQTPVEYSSDHSSSRYTPVIPNGYPFTSGSNTQRPHPCPIVLSSPSSSSSSHSRSQPQSHYDYHPSSGQSPTSTTPRYFRRAESTAIRITRPDGTPVPLPSPVKERRYT